VTDNEQRSLADGFNTADDNKKKLTQVVCRGVYLFYM